MIPERLEKPGFEERLSSLLRSILGRSLEPEADFEADAAAAGMVRDPLALARALKKAEARAASGERLSPAYGPMLLVGPGSKNEGFRRAAGWKVPRPSPKARIRRLADLAGADPNRIL
jgi:Zn-dependent protease with chaperone function